VDVAAAGYTALWAAAAASYAPVEVPALLATAPQLLQLPLLQLLLCLLPLSAQLLLLHLLLCQQLLSLQPPLQQQLAKHSVPQLLQQQLYLRLLPRWLLLCLRPFCLQPAALSA
jgi:hypothetical protein